MVEFTYGAQTVQLVVYATESLGLGRGGYGVLLAAGVGGLLSAVSNGALSTSRRVTLIVIGGGLLACATQLAYASVGCSRSRSAYPCSGRRAPFHARLSARLRLLASFRVAWWGR